MRTFLTENERETDDVETKKNRSNDHDDDSPRCVGRGSRAHECVGPTRKKDDEKRKKKDDEERSSSRCLLVKKRRMRQNVSSTGFCPRFEAYLRPRPTYGEQITAHRSRSEETTRIRQCPPRIIMRDTRPWDVPQFRVFCLLGVFRRDGNGGTHCSAETGWTTRRRWATRPSPLRMTFRFQLTRRDRSRGRTEQLSGRNAARRMHEYMPSVMSNVVESNRNRRTREDAATSARGGSAAKEDVGATSCT